MRVQSVQKNTGNATVTLVPCKAGNDIFGDMQNVLGGSNCVYHWENSLSFLDQSGEWYQDKTNSVLYYKPYEGEDMNQLEIIYPSQDKLFEIAGTGTHPVYNVTLQNIEFACGNWSFPSQTGYVANQAAEAGSQMGYTPPFLATLSSWKRGLVLVNYARNISIINCNIFGAGGEGIIFGSGVKKSNITACHFDRISGNAIRIDTMRIGFQQAAILCSENIIAHNLIENMGMSYTNGVGVFSSCSNRLTVENNEIRYGPYTGMQIGDQYGEADCDSKENLIRGNHVHHLMRIHDDGGGIYTLGRQRGTIISRNYVHDVKRGAWAGEWGPGGIYLDNYSSYITVEDNVLANNTISITQQTNEGIAAHDNYLINNVEKDPIIEAEAGPKMPTGVQKKTPVVTAVPMNERLPLIIYPNPTTGEVWIENGDLPKENTLKIYNMAGGLVSEKYFLRHSPVSLTHLPRGVYIMRIGDYTGKIVKE
jgi:hypothetical protein